ncbi:uncharacterized protein [Bemisia tabaci]|uniref:uncharacterized protein n=1 Tax=Bemisia tabaci TaxID=7038 RepID=UPI003B28AF47
MSSSLFMPYEHHNVSFHQTTFGVNKYLFSYADQSLSSDFKGRSKSIFQLNFLRQQQKKYAHVFSYHHSQSNFVRNVTRNEPRVVLCIGLFHISLFVFVRQITLKHALIKFCRKNCRARSNLSSHKDIH